MFAGRVGRDVWIKDRHTVAEWWSWQFIQLLVEGSLCYVHLDMEDTTAPSSRKISTRLGLVQGQRWHQDTSELQLLFQSTHPHITLLSNNEPWCHWSSKCFLKPRYKAGTPRPLSIAPCFVITRVYSLCELSCLFPLCESGCSTGVGFSTFQPPGDRTRTPG